MRQVRGQGQGQGRQRQGQGQGQGQLTTGRKRLALLLAAAAVLAGGCSGTADKGSSADRAQLRGGSLAKDYDLSGSTFTVGSKEFTEQQVLGKIMIYALRAAGARTSDQTGLNGSTIVRGALKSGDVDMYWEYSGTGWTQFLGHDSPVEGAPEQFRATAREDEKRNGVVWLGPARFGNQYALARAADAPGPAGGTERLSDLKGLAQRHPQEMTLCGASEFLDRELMPLQETYDVKIPAVQVSQNAFALNFVNVAKGSPCRFAEVFTTDARIKSLDLKVLDDDKGHFTTELAGLTLRKETLKEHPELGDLAHRIGGKLTEKTMIELNGMVDLEGETSDEAALHFLRTNGFIGR